MRSSHEQGTRKREIDRQTDRQIGGRQKAETFERFESVSIRGYPLSGIYQSSERIVTKTLSYTHRLVYTGPVSSLDAVSIRGGIETVEQRKREEGEGGSERASEAAVSR